MQTFMPYSDFVKSAAVLDRQRLGKQRVEVLQLLKALLGGGGWANHPATKMWRGHENALVVYGMAVCEEWIKRGYKDTCHGKIRAYWDKNSRDENPSWVGEEAVHSSHRSNLLRKDPKHYGQFGWQEPDTIPYVWPVE